MHGCRHGIAVVNGTVALRIALLAAGIQAEDEVIVPPYTFVATATAVLEANAVPVFADIDLHTFNLDPAAVEAAITPRTRAIIPVHFAGQPADMDAIMAIARIAASSCSRTPRTRMARRTAAVPPARSDTSRSFSFQSSKNLTAGEGGIITTNDDALAEACRSIHNCGRVPGGVWYEHHVISGNYRLGEFQGAVLNCQLDRLEEQTAHARRNGRRLASRLAALPGLHPQGRPPSARGTAITCSCCESTPAEFGASREARARRAGRPRAFRAPPGYGYSLPDQPLFRNKAFGPYLPALATAGLPRRSAVPTAIVICREQGLWLGQNLLLGDARDIDDIARAFEKVYAHREARGSALRRRRLSWTRRRPLAARRAR